MLRPISILGGKRRSEHHQASFFWKTIESSKIILSWRNRQNITLELRKLDKSYNPDYLKYTNDKFKDMTLEDT